MQLDFVAQGRRLILLQLFPLPASLQAMSFLKMILTLLGAAAAVIVGLLTAAAFVIGSLFFHARRPRTHHDGHSTSSGRQRVRPGMSGDVIDVTATEVPAEPSNR